MEPKTIVAGDTAEWAVGFGSYKPDDGWALQYTLYNAQGRIQFNGSDNGDGSFAISVAATTTGEWAPGDYRFIATVTKAAERFTVRDGEICIKPNFATQSDGFDDRTIAQKYLDDLLAARDRLVSGAYRVTVSSESMPGVSRTFRTLDEIDGAIQRARRDVNRDARKKAAAEGRSHHGRVKVRFDS